MANAYPGRLRLPFDVGASDSLDARILALGEVVADARGVLRLGDGVTAGGVRQAIIERIYIDTLPGVKEGVATPSQRAINRASINAALALGKMLRFRPGSYIEIDQSLVMATGAGIICDQDGTRPELHMPAEHFTNTTIRSYDANAVGILINGLLNGALTPITDVLLAGFAITGSGTDGRDTTAIGGRNGARITIDRMDIGNMALGRGIALSSMRDCDVLNCHVHNFYTNSDVWAAGSNPNNTAIEIDQDRVGALGSHASSDAIRIRNPKIADITTGPVFRAKFGGDQSDGINEAGAWDPSIGSTNNLLIEGFDIRRVGEAIDKFGSYGRVVNGYIEDAGELAFKLIHGASFNVIEKFQAVRCGRGGISIAGTGTGARGTRGNRISAGEIDQIDPLNLFGNQASAIRFQPNNGTVHQPRDNSVEGITVRLGSNAGYAWNDNSTGNDNRGRIRVLDPQNARARPVDIANPRWGSYCELEGYTGRYTLVNSWPPSNLTVVNESPFVPALAQEFLSIVADAARTIILPPGWEGTIVDRNGQAAANNITISRTQACTITGGIDGATLTVTATTGIIFAGHRISGAGVTAGTYIRRQLSGVIGGAGTYELSVSHAVAVPDGSSIAAANEGGIASAAGEAPTYVINTNRGRVTLKWKGATNGWDVVAT